MTNLERVREAILRGRSVAVSAFETHRNTEAMVGASYDTALADLDAHLKEDAEREKRSWRPRYEDEHHKRLTAEAELTELRDAVRAVETLLPDRGWVNQDEARALARLRQLIEEKP